eukprot:6159861-Amphidinium_carterae.1
MTTKTASRAHFNLIITPQNEVLKQPQTGTVNPSSSAQEPLEAPSRMVVLLEAASLRFHPHFRPCGVGHYTDTDERSGPKGRHQDLQQRAKAALRWMKAHQTQAAVDQGKVTAADLFGNGQADT